MIPFRHRESDGPPDSLTLPGALLPMPALAYPSKCATVAQPTASVMLAAVAALRALPIPGSHPTSSCESPVTLRRTPVARGLLAGVRSGREF